MMTPTTCRAARGLLRWSQQQLAEAAHVGISTVKKFEAGRTVPVPNNLAAMRKSLESAGIEFLGTDTGNAGVRKVPLRFRAFNPGEGLSFDYRHSDPHLVADSQVTLWFRIDEEALSALAHRRVEGEADAQDIARQNLATIIAAIERRLATRGLGSVGGGPRVLSIADIRNANEGDRSGMSLVDFLRATALSEIDIHREPDRGRDVAL